MRAQSAHPRRDLRSTGGLLAAVSAALLAGACSSGGALDGLESLGSMLDAPPPSASASADKAIPGQKQMPKTELDRAITYWADEHKKKPHDLKSALAYARNLKAAGHKEQAFSVLQAASLLHGDSRELASEYGRLALEFDQIEVAQKLLAMADDSAKPDWRLVSARGTVFAKQGRFAEAIPFYERALELAPGQPSLLNNLAMARAASGEADKAERILREASLKSTDPKLKQNLAIVLGLQGKHDEAKLVSAQHLSAEAAQSNVEFVRAMVKTQAPPQPVPAVAVQAAPPAKSARSKGTGRIIDARTTPAETMRPSGGPSDVPSSGGWSTTVSIAR